MLFYLERLFHFLSSHINIWKIGPEIHEKLQVEQTKLQICQSQTKSDINWKCHHYTRKWMASLESKSSKLKTESETAVSWKKSILKHKLPNRPILMYTHTHLYFFNQTKISIVFAINISNVIMKKFYFTMKKYCHLKILKYYCFILNSYTLKLKVILLYRLAI